MDMTWPLFWCAGLVVVLLPSMFTNSLEVAAMMKSFLPFMCVALLVHTASMATEGILLAGALPCFPHPSPP